MLGSAELRQIMLNPVNIGSHRRDPSGIDAVGNISSFVADEFWLMQRNETAAIARDGSDCVEDGIDYFALRKLGSVMPVAAVAFP